MNQRKYMLTYKLMHTYTRTHTHTPPLSGLLLSTISLHSTKPLATPIKFSSKLNAISSTLPLLQLLAWVVIASTHSSPTKICIYTNTHTQRNTACRVDNLAWKFSSGRGTNPILALLMSLTLVPVVHPSVRPSAVDWLAAGSAVGLARWRWTDMS